MKTLALEIRDANTFIPVVAVQMTSENEGQRYLLRRCGYPLDRPQVILCRMSGDGMANSDPYAWDTRTMAVAHDYILHSFDLLRDGDVVDVEFILGLRKEPKKSERFTVPLED